MLSTAAAEPGLAATAPAHRVAAPVGRWRPSTGHPQAATSRTRRLLPLAAVAGAHLALLVALAHALRWPVVPPALATLSVQLLGAELPAPAAPPSLPDLAPPAVRLPAPVWAPPPVVVAEAPTPPLAPTVQPAATPTTPPPPPAAALAMPPAPAPAAVVAVAEPPAPPAPAPERQVSIDQVAYLQPPVLAYPLAARRLREQGQVLVRVRVDETGRPAQAVLQQSSGSRTLDDAALAAVAATRFKPYREGGVPRPFWVVMPLVFSLDA
jgi:periplasmic protein TonB